MQYTGHEVFAFTIAKKTVTADNKSIQVGTGLPTPTVNYSGFIGTDSGTNIPKTGDGSNAAIWWMVLLSSILDVLTVCVRKKRLQVRGT